MDELTFGQIAVGLDFNPSGDPDVIKIKQLYADIIDNLNDLSETTNSQKKKRWCAIAITQAELAQMAAVKAFTWKDPVYVPVDFDEDVLLESEIRPVLVDFYGEKCAPCIAILPKLKSLAKEKNFSLVKIDARREPELAERFKVLGLPRLILFADGQVYWDSASEKQWPGVMELVDLVALNIDALRSGKE